MGKRKKRRGMNTDENKVNEDSTHTVSDDNSVSHDSQDSSLVSNILNAASNVLYGSPFNLTKSKTDTRNDNCTENDQITSTPISSETEKSRSRFTRTQDNAVRKALDTMNSKIDSVLEKLSKLDTVEKKLNEITADVAHLGKKVNNLEKNSKEYEKSLDYLHKEVEDVRKENVDSRNLKSELNRHTKMIESMSRGLESLRRDRKVLHDDITDLRWRSMKNNLVFTGLGGEVRGENTQEKLKVFLQQELGIQQEIDFANVHRFGKHKDGRHRPIVARFIYNKDRTMIMDSAYRLKGKPYGIQEQLPNVMEERRRELYPLMKQMRQEGRRVKLVRDKLIVDGRLYSAGDDDEDDIEYDQNGETRNTENHVLESSRIPESQGEEYMEIPVDPRTVDLR